MSGIFHVDTQFLRSALGVFEDLRAFEQAGRSRDAAVRAKNVATLVDALDLCNLLVLADRIVFDGEVGGGRRQKVLDQIDRVAASLGDDAAADRFRASFGGVAPADEAASQALQLAAARGSTAFFLRLARCATNVLDLYHLPVEPPTDPAAHLLRFVEEGRPPAPAEIERIAASKEITGRRFYAALLSDETAFKALCDARQQGVEVTDEVLAVLFMNFRLRLAEERSLAREKVLLGAAAGGGGLEDALAYVPSMGRRDFSREFSQFVRSSRDAGTRNGHAFDLGLREVVFEEWQGVGCQLQLSERRAIPIVVASVLGSPGLARSRRPEALLVECLRWRAENQARVAQIRRVTQEFEALGEPERQTRAAAYVAEILRAPTAETARNRDLLRRLALPWLGTALRLTLNPHGTLANLVADTTEKVREHFRRATSREYLTATHLSEAARPILAGVGPDLRQCLIDVFGGTVLDARNPQYDPDRFAASA